MSEVSGSGQPQPSQSGAGAEQLFEQVQSRLTQLQMDPLPDKRAATQKVAQLSTINVYLNWLLLAQECNIEVAPQNLLKATQMRAQLLPAPFPIIAAPVRTDCYEEELRLWHLAWASEYKPNPALRAFTLAVNKYAQCDPEDVFARVLPLIQGSGAGKSRMLDETAKSVFTIPICLRPPDGNGYPPGDIDARIALVGSSNDDFRVRFLVFLKHVFRQTRERLLGQCVVCLATNSLHQLNAASARASLTDPFAWREYLETDRNREELYKDAEANVREEIGVGRQKQQRDNPASKRARTDPNTPGSKGPLAALISDLHESIESLSKLVTTVILYIDDAHELVRVSGDAIASLMSVLAEVRQAKGLLVILVSIIPDLAWLATSPENSQMARFGSRKLGQRPLIQPWTYCPSKVFSIAPLKGEAHYTPEHVRTLSVAAKMGRPLWGAALIYRPSSDQLSPEHNMKELAYLKLTFNRDLDSPPNRDSIRAALVCRLHLVIEKTSAGAALSSYLIKCRMATALYVDTEPAFLKAAFSIDPIIARAALQVISAAEPSQLLDGLIDMTREALIERDPNGGLVTKFAFVQAYDQTLRQIHCLDALKAPYDKISKVPWFSGVALGDFLTKLQGSRDILGVKDLAGEAQLASVAGHSLVLAQWTGSMVFDADVGVNMALYALITHCGVQLPHVVPGVDHMLAACKDPKLPVSKDNLLVILSQTRNPLQVKPEPLPIDIVQRFTAKGVPVIYILHEVSSKEDFRMVRDDEPLLDLSSALEPTGDRNLQAPLWCLKMESVHPELLGGASLVPLLQLQTEPFAGRGGVEVEHILDMMPMLSNEKGTMNRMWDNDEIGFWDSD